MKSIYEEEATEASSERIPPRLLTEKGFPECADDCGLVRILGVGECEAVCPSKFDEEGKPVAT